MSVLIRSNFSVVSEGGGSSSSADNQSALWKVQCLEDMMSHIFMSLFHARTDYRYCCASNLTIQTKLDIAKEEATIYLWPHQFNERSRKFEGLVDLDLDQELDKFVQELQETPGVKVEESALDGVPILQMGDMQMQHEFSLTGDPYDLLNLAFEIMEKHELLCFDDAEAVETTPKTSEAAQQLQQHADNFLRFQANEVGEDVETLLEASYENMPLKWYPYRSMAVLDGWHNTREERLPFSLHLAQQTYLDIRNKPLDKDRLSEWTPSLILQ